VFYEDKDIVVFETRMHKQQNASPQPAFGSQLRLLAAKAQQTLVLDAHFLTVDLIWQALDGLTDQTNMRCELSLRDSGGKAVARTGDLVSPRYPTSRWQAGTVVGERYALPANGDLARGDYVLSISVTDALGQIGDTHELAVSLDGTSALAVPALNAMQQPADITFGEQMWLLGYTPNQEGALLRLDLYWQALRAMRTKYKIFVHLIDPVTGNIVAQHDSMPRDWSYPTSLWDRQEVFVDRVGLDVSDVKPGSYRLAVGVYEPEGDRLAAVDRQGRPVADGRAILTQPIEVNTP
jgi:hypothetical protein